MVVRRGNPPRPHGTVPERAGIVDKNSEVKLVAVANVLGRLPVMFMLTIVAPTRLGPKTESGIGPSTGMLVIYKYSNLVVFTIGHVMRLLAMTSLNEADRKFGVPAAPIVGSVTREYDDWIVIDSSSWHPVQSGTLTLETLREKVRSRGKTESGGRSPYKLFPLTDSLSRLVRFAICGGIVI